MKCKLRQDRQKLFGTSIQHRSPGRNVETKTVGQSAWGKSLQQKHQNKNAGDTDYPHTMETRRSSTRPIL